MKTTQEILDSKDPLEVEWVELELTEKRSHLRIRVSSDAVKRDGVRLTVTARQHQVIADRLGAFLPTSKICDLIHARADLRVKPAVFYDRGSAIEEAGMLSQSIDTDLGSDLMQKAADGAKNLIDGRKIALVSNVGLNWVLSNQMEYDGDETCLVSRHGIYTDNEGPTSEVMPWRYRCRWVGRVPESDTMGSVLHFARLVHGEVRIGEAGGPHGRLRWEKQRLDWALMHTSLAPMLHQGPMLRWTRVPTVPPALPR